MANVLTVRLGSLLAVYVLLAVTVLLPVLSVRIPAMGDTLNHLARMHVLAAYAHSTDLQKFYRIQWAPIPYLAMDAVVPSLIALLGTYAAGKAYLCLCVAMPPVASATLHWVLHRRFSLVPAAAFLLSYNTLLSLGFLNFLFTSGFAVILFALWIAAGSWAGWRRAAVFAPLVLLLYLGHVFACLGYCLCVAGYEIGLAARRAPASPAATLLRFGWAAAQALPALLLAATFRMQDAYVGPLHTIYGTPMDKLFAFASPVLFAVDAADAMAIAGVALAGALLARRLRLDASAWPAALALLLAGLAVPHLLLSTWGTDLRLPFMLAMVLAGSLSAAPQPAAHRWPPWSLAAPVLLIGLVAAKSAGAWAVMRRVSDEAQQTRELLQAMPRGQRLLVVNVGRGVPGADPSPSSRWNMPLVAVIDRDAFVPYFFSGLSTVHINPAFRDASTPNGFPITPAQLRDGQAASHADAAGGAGGDRLYHYGWPAKFDYVLVQRFGLAAGALPDVLRPVSHSRDLDLYLVNKRQ